MKKLFSERVGKAQPRVKEALDAATARGLLAIIRDRISENWFGMAFPAECEDGGRNIGHDEAKLRGRLAAFNLVWPGDGLSDSDQLPEDHEVFDLLEFSFEHIARPEVASYHDFFRHNH